MKTRHTLLMMLVLLPTISLAETAVDERLQAYQSQGAGAFKVEAGKAMWTRAFTPADGGKTRACSSCHGTDLQKPGKHVSTGKAIDAMSPATVPQRLSDADKIEKWFGRNCKWTMGRECTPQEKGDFLTYIQSQ